MGIEFRTVRKSGVVSISTYPDAGWRFLATPWSSKIEPHFISHFRGVTTVEKKSLIFAAVAPFTQL